jgi:YHS domain-containing protein
VSRQILKRGLVMWLESSRRHLSVILQIAATVVLVLMAGAALGADEKAAGEKAAVDDTYPLETCIVTGAKLGSMGAPVVYDYEGREIRFCCQGCVRKFEADPEAYVKKMDEAIIAREKPAYPLETCVVTGQRLGSMGDPVDYIYENHLVRFCCAGCVKAFEKEPAKYMAMLDEARVTPYPLDTCIVSDAKLGSMGEPVALVYEGQEVKFCCAGCIGAFKNDPDTYMKKLNPAGDAPAEAVHDHSKCGGH